MSLLVALVLLGWSATAHAGYTVYQAQAGEGSITNDSTCNLSDALDSVRLGYGAHGCTGPASPYIYLRASTGSVTYKLNSTTYIYTNTTIYSEPLQPTYKVTIGGYMNGDMFNVPYSGTLLHLEHLTLKHMNGSGRHVYSSGKLEVWMCTLTNGGTALSGGDAIGGGSILNSLGDVSIKYSTFSNNHGSTGGAIENSNIDKSMSIENSVFTGNSAEIRGGAIYSLGSAGVDIRWSTLSGNSAVYSGGALHSAGRVQMTNSTVSGNTVSNGGGGGISAGAGQNNYLELFYSTVAFNKSSAIGGGVDVQGSGAPTLTSHCIIAKNTYGANNTKSDYNGNAQSGGAVKSVFGVKPTNYAGFDSNANIVGDPLLGGLSTNGYTATPVLKTHAIPSNSIAKDIISNSDISQNGRSTDERGLTRGCVTANGYCDAGAYERQ